MRRVLHVEMLVVCLDLVDCHYLKADSFEAQISELSKTAVVRAASGHPSQHTKQVDHLQV